MVYYVLNKNISQLDIETIKFNLFQKIYIKIIQKMEFQNALRSYWKGQKAAYSSKM